MELRVFSRFVFGLGLVSLLIILAFPLSAATGGKRYAILVGVSEYLDSGILKLTTPRNDAKDLAVALQSMGWDRTFILTDDADARSPDFPTRSNIEKRVGLLADLAGVNDTVLLFFSGHGVSQDGEDCFLPVDADLNRLKDSGIVIRGMVKSFNDRGITRVVLAVDACRETVTRTKGLSVVGVAGKAVATPAAGAPALALYATQAGWYSYEDKGGRNGVFTRFLIEGLKGQAAPPASAKSADVSAADLSGWLPAAVSAYALDQGIRQKPVALVSGVNAASLILGRGTPPTPPAPSPSVAPAPSPSSQAASLASPAASAAPPPAKVDPVRKLQYARLVEQAVAKREANDLAASRKYLDDAVRMLPAEAQAYYEYGVSWERSNDPAKAVEWYLKAHAAKPDLPYLNQNLAINYRALEAHEDAVPHLEAEIRLYPDHVWSWVEYGNLLVWYRNDVASARLAVPIVLKACAFLPDDPYVRTCLARAWEILGEKDNMYQALRLALPLFQDWLRQDQRKDGWEDIRRQIDRINSVLPVSATKPAATPPAPDPAKSAQYDKLVEQFWSKRGQAGARALLDQAIRLQPGRAPAYYAYGLSYEDAGDAAKALEWYLKAQAIDPALSDLNVHTGRMFQWLGRFADASPYFERELLLSPKNAWAGEIYGEMLVFNLGDKASARLAAAVLDRSKALQPGSPYTWQNRGRAAEILGDWAIAEANYQQAILLFGAQLKDNTQKAGWPNFRERIASMENAIGRLSAAAAVPAASMANLAPVESLSGYGDNMITLKGGSFMMGNPVFPDGAPVHQVTVQNFQLGATEVDSGLYQLVVEWAIQEGHAKIQNGELVLAAPGGKKLCYPDQKPYRVESGRLVMGVTSEMPVTGITWYGAVAFCNWLSLIHGLSPAYDLATWEWDRRSNGFRLPTSAEWEFAARHGGKSQKYPWGDAAPLIGGKPAANIYDLTSYRERKDQPYKPEAPKVFPDYDDGSDWFTAVNRFPVNELGFRDLGGNVQEWCWDRFGAYSLKSATDPVGPDRGTMRVLRDCVPWSDMGGLALLAAWRRGMDPDRYSGWDDANVAGFRLARNAP